MNKKLKIAYCGDVHLEFGPIMLHNDQAADLLILAGDICTVRTFRSKPRERFELIDFFSNCSAQFTDVIYIMGNHESYDYDIAKTVATVRTELAQFPNIHVMEKETIDIGDFTFVAGTLWTDMNKNDSLTLWHCGKHMNDFQLIKNSNRGISGGGYASRWSPEDSVADHEQMLDYIRIATEDKTRRYVVVGHHAPSTASIAECYKGDTLMNGAFHSDLSEFILDRPQIRLWVHGHMHNVSDYMLGTTRVVCNPRGYTGYESRADQFELQHLEI